MDRNARIFFLVVTFESTAPEMFVEWLPRLPCRFFVSGSTLAVTNSQDGDIFLELSFGTVKP